MYRAMERLVRVNIMDNQVEWLKYKRWWTDRHSLITLVVVAILFIVPILGNILSHYGIATTEDGSDLINRAAILLVLLIGLLGSYKYTYYYVNNIKIEDVILTAYVIFVLISMNGIVDVEAISGLVRMIACYYIVAYIMRKGGYINVISYLFIIFVGFFLLWLLVNLPALFDGNGRLAYTGTANTTARDLVALFSILYVVTINRRMFSPGVRSVAKLECAAILLFLIPTGSRQGLILGILYIILAKKLFTGFVDMADMLKRLLQFTAAGSILLAVLSVLIGLFGEDMFGRFAFLSIEENMDRVLRYEVYWKYINHNIGALMLDGVNIETLFGEEMVRVRGVKIGAPHNMFLEVGLRHGIMAVTTYGLWHVFLFRRMFKVHNAIGGLKTSAAALAIASSAFIIGLVTNYFTQVSVPLGYLFYMIAGIYTNIARDLNIH